MTNGWMVRVAISMGLLAVAACDVDVKKCVGEFCGEWPDFDAGPELDAAKPDASGPDSSAPVDASGIDAARDAGTDAAADTGPVVVDAGGTLALASFCDAQYARAKAWYDLLVGPNCSCVSTADQAAVNDLLVASMRFDPSMTVSSCAARLDSLMALGVSYDATKARACAERYAGQFAAPPANCASTGVDVAMIESTLGHGAQALVQLAECRAAFVGSRARDAACEESFQCGGGLRCLPKVDSGKFCQPARGLNESCEVNGDCADGHICAVQTTTTALPDGGVGAVRPATRVCIEATPIQLKAPGAKCGLSSECVSGYLCSADYTCVAPAAEVICK